MHLSVILIFSLVLIILFHELGHFLFARFFGVAIERFSIGFGPSLFSWTSKKHFTQFSFCPLLFGGYVKFSEKNFLNHQTFDSISPFKKILILFAGPLANILLAFLLITIVVKMDSFEPNAIVGTIEQGSLFAKNGVKSQTRLLRLNDKAVKTWSDVWPLLYAQRKNILVLENSENMQTTVVFPAIKKPEQFFKILGFQPFVYQVPAIVGGFTKNSAAQRQGLILGDKILKIDGHPVQDIQQLAFKVRASTKPKVDLELMRNGKKFHQTIILDAQKTKSGKTYFLGVTSEPYEHFPEWFSLKKHSWFEAIDQGAKITGQLIGLQFHSWGQVQDVFKQISGPVGMVKTAQHAWSLSPKAYLFFLAWLSIGVGILNLLPIPILDGGQIFMLILTKFFKNLEKEYYKKFLFLISFVAILGLMMLGVINDGFH